MNVNESVLTFHEWAQHLEIMERGRPTYPVVMRPFRRWQTWLIGPNGSVVSDRYGVPRTRRDAERRAAEWNAWPLRPGWRLEAHRD